MIRITRNTLAASLALACAAPFLASSAYASVAIGGNANITLNGQSVSYTITKNTFDGTNFDFEGNGTGFSFSITGHNDPLLNWGFTATAPGLYVVNLSAPVSGAPYNTIKNQGSLTLSDGGGASGSSVTSVALNGQDPAGTNVPGVTLVGDLSVPAGGINSLPYNPLTSTGTFSGTTFQENLNFNFASADNDGSAGFVGQLQLSNTPEPASFSLLALTAAPLLCRRRRNA